MAATFLLTLVLLTLASLPAGRAAAANLQVNPVNIMVQPGARAATVTIRNAGDKPASVRVLVYRWTQENGQDVRTPATELIASPPIFTAAPGASQIVRVGLKTPASDQEQAYRVVFEEIPSPSNGRTGIQVLVKLDLPFYKLPKGGGAPDVQWSATRSADGDVVLTGSNRGALHHQVLELSSVDGSGTRSSLSRNMGVVLPGGARQWKIGKHPELASGREFNLLVRGASGETQAPVRLDAR